MITILTIRTDLLRMTRIVCFSSHFQGFFSLFLKFFSKKKKKTQNQNSEKTLGFFLNSLCS